MPDSIDSLHIKIDASATSANSAINNLVKKLDRLETSVRNIDTSRLSKLSIALKSVGKSAKSLNGINSTDFASLAKSIRSLNNIDTSRLAETAKGIRKIGSSFSGIKGMANSAKQFAQVANGVKQLGYKSAEKAITNIPLLAKSMRQLMTELSKAPKINKSVIDMTNALAKLARTGASSGKAANSLSSAFNNMSVSASRVGKSTFGALGGVKSLGRQLLSAVGLVGGIYALINGIKKSIEVSSSLEEIQNVIDVTFGTYKDKIEELSKVSIPELGMSELTTKQIASRFQAMGTAMGFTTEKMANMSVDLVRLTGDMASFYDVEQKAVGEDLEAIFTGQTKPLRQYGLDLTEATLQEWALKNGIDANINSMSQMEKTFLRYQYVMANTTAAQGDFIRTQDSFANQIRILKQQLQQLAGVLGTAFVNSLKPLIKALNTALSAVISFAEMVVNALGKIFGWKARVSKASISEDFSDAADYADDIAGSTGTAANNIKKMQAGLRAFDELKNITMPDNSSSSGGGGGANTGAGTTGGSNENFFTIEEQESLFESSINSLNELGKSINKTLTDTLKGIKWDEIYEGAKNFGKGLADFLNGLISPELFGQVGKTIAASLNTSIYTALSFAENFDFSNLGESIAEAINQFFTTFDFVALAESINAWVDGIKETIITLIDKVQWKDVFNGIKELLSNLELDTVMILIGAFTIKNAKQALTSMLGASVATKIGTASITNLALKAAAVTLVAIDSFKWGEEIGEIIFDQKMPDLKVFFADESIKEIADEVYNAWGDMWRDAGIIVTEKIEEIDSNLKIKLGLLEITPQEYVFNNATNGVTLAQELMNQIASQFNIDLNVNTKTNGENDPKGEKLKNHSNNFKSKTVDYNANTNTNGKKDTNGKVMSAINNLFAKNWNSKTTAYDAITSVNGKKSTKGNAMRDVNSAFSKYFTGKTVSYNIKTQSNSDLIALGQNAANKIFAGMSKKKITLELQTAAGTNELDKLLKGSYALKVNTYATGGFPEDGWFRASKGEYFGKFDDGTTYIANNRQIENGIASEVSGAVRIANSEQNSLLREQNSLLRAILNKETGINYKDVFNATRKASREHYIRTGNNALVY